MNDHKRRMVLRIGFLSVGLAAAGGTALAARATCWMTGGGRIFAADESTDASYGGQIDTSGRVTHGFVLHCTPRKSDNLQIVDHSGQQSFHLEAVTSATCFDDPAISPNPPGANFDTFIGAGVGRCKQPDRPCSVTWTFTDGGEQGGCAQDGAVLVVSDADGIVFAVSGDVHCGNHQAHSN